MSGDGAKGAKSYKEKKTHKGKTYSGMRVGGVHSWTYPDGSWKERKVDPKRWEFTYASRKDRDRRAPKGSGAGEGSGYHWYITAHQWVRKLDANRYATFMEGNKRLISFQKPDWQVWNSQFKNQRSADQRVIEALEDEIERVREAPKMENPWEIPTYENLILPKIEKEEREREMITAIVREEELAAAGL
ncbi:MAG: hypothetical protein KY455_02770 [Euryarchaeota archaeon]|nr:hypothetical protein [Euryarchaeota archaeon]